MVLSQVSAVVIVLLREWTLKFMREGAVTYDSFLTEEEIKVSQKQNKLNKTQ
jgi:hypothetical protein